MCSLHKDAHNNITKGHSRCIANNHPCTTSCTAAPTITHLRGIRMPVARSHYPRTHIDIRQTSHQDPLLTARILTTSFNLAPIPPLDTHKLHHLHFTTSTKFVPLFPISLRTTTVIADGRLHFNNNSQTRIARAATNTVVITNTNIRNIIIPPEEAQKQIWIATSLNLALEGVPR